MNRLHIPAEYTAAPTKIQSADNTCIGSRELRQQAVSYEHEGYRIRVHFSGDKTLTQCIHNLAERRIGG